MSFTQILLLFNYKQLDKRTKVPTFKIVLVEQVHNASNSIHWWTLKVDMPILTCIFFTFNWLTLTSEMHFVKFCPEVASCLLSRGKRKYAPLGMRLLWKYIRNYFLVYHLTSHLLLYLPNYKEFEAEIFDLQLEKYGLSFDIKKYTTSGWALGDENVISIGSFNICLADFNQLKSIWQLKYYRLILYEQTNWSLLHFLVAEKKIKIIRLTLISHCIANLPVKGCGGKWQNDRNIGVGHSAWAHAGLEPGTSRQR